MKITLLQGAFLPIPPLRGGAIEKAWFRLGKSFAREGHEVTHVSRLCDGLPINEAIEGVNHVRIRGFEATCSSFLLKWRDFRYVLRARRALPPADILVTNAFWAPLLVRDSSLGAQYVHVGRYPKGQMKLYGRAKRLQAPSEAIAAAIQCEVPSKADIVKTIPYPLSWDLVEPVPTRSSREQTILYLGRIHPEKGLCELVKAFAGLPEELRRQWRLDVRGPWKASEGGGGRDFLENLKNLVGPAKEAIRFLDPVFDDVKLREELGRASLFIYPSMAERGETFGLAALEAMSCGCPPLVSGLDCFRDFVQDGSTGFVFDHRGGDAVANLSAKMIEVLSKPERLSLIGNAAYGQAQNFTLDRVSKRFLDDFSSILPAS
ncbi:MAG: glycosyltransferase family 4 protein [Verrucomicrobia bacterium]|nr:glycosyltransferase family 4 protein [Verrucomicrobiota bacterium]MDA1045627.1 glycosyltransferase family 4 protein [Verrucomicrobiota bacterium]